MDLTAGFPGVVNASAPTGIQETRWRGASRSLRSLANWITQQGSAKSDLPGSEQRTLRGRSRDAFRGDPIARAALTRSRTNIVGTGLMARPSVDAKALGLTEEQAEAVNEQLQRHWEAWGESPVDCDAEATLDIYGLQSLVLLSAMLSGDCFAITPYEVHTDGMPGLKVRLVEADRCSNPNDGINTTTLHDGVVLNGAKPVGYWIRSNHPGDDITAGGMLPEWRLYAAYGESTGRRRVLHIWNDKERPDQVRGAPFLAPVLDPLKQVSRYSSAKLMNAVVDAMLTVFITKEKEAFDQSGNPLGIFEGDPNATAGTATAAPSIALGEGAIVDLAPGEKPEQVSRVADSNFDGYFMAIVKQIGAALELPVDELLLHYQSSYSAARAAMLQAWRFYLSRRWTLVQQFCAPIYGLFVDELVASGRVTLPGYADPMRRSAWTRCLWIGPARGAMDEKKEAEASKARIDAGISNETLETAAQTGESWTVVNAQRAREIAQRKRNGTYVDPSKQAAPAPPADPPDEENQQDREHSQ